MRCIRYLDEENKKENKVRNTVCLKFQYDAFCGWSGNVSCMMRMGFAVCLKQKSMDILDCLLTDYGLVGITKREIIEMCNIYSYGEEIIDECCTFIETLKKWKNHS